MPRPDVSDVTQDQVEALFDKDGDLREPSSLENDSTDEDLEDTEPAEESDEPEAEDQEDEAEEEDEESEDSEEEDEEEESEDTEAELDWDEVDPAYREEFEKAKAESQKWERAHAKLQSQRTKDSKAQREEESTLTSLRAKAQTAEKWEALLEQYPEVRQVLERELSRIRDPFSDVPAALKEDPAFQYMQRMNQQLETRLAKFEKAAKVTESWESEQQQAKGKQQLDGLLDQARSEIKSMFGRDATEDEITQVLEYMVDKKFYEDGSIAALKVFGNQYKKALTTRRDEDLRQKAKKFPPRSKSVNPNRAAKSSEDATTPQEALARAMADQGYGV